MMWNGFEADTMMLSAYSRLRADGYTGPVVLDSEDTDVYVQAAYVSHQVDGQLLIKRKQDLISCSSMLSNEVANIIIPLHVISGSDHTSGFYGCDKKRLLQKIINDPAARDLLSMVGASTECREEVKTDMKSFVLSKMYSANFGSTCAEARATKWRTMKKKNTVRLPPDDDSLNHHLDRVNFISFCQMHYDLLEHPSLINNGWEIKDGRCRPVGYSRPPLPYQFSSPAGVEDSDSSSDSDCDSEQDSDMSEESDVDDSFMITIITCVDFLSRSHVL